MTENENIVRQVCRELNITQRELGEMLDTPQSTIGRWASTGEIPKMATLALKQMLELRAYKEASKKLGEALDTLKKLQD